MPQEKAKNERNFHVAGRTEYMNQNMQTCYHMKTEGLCGQLPLPDGISNTRLG